ncbi:MAG: YhjD/YihY/BrkB family envelope integrity protein [Gammaproteobacteria bacterium]|nr:YhjD/YihY/BrkB family envelope integrity protein [Gammaproteobacteria bacterium]
MNQAKKNVLSDCITAIKEMHDSDYSYRASSLAFSTLLSLVPMISVFVFIMTKAPIFSRLNILAKDYVIENFVPASSSQILIYLDRFSHLATKLPIFSILFLFVTSTFLVITIDDSMNAIWHNRARKKDLTHLIIYPFMMLFIPIFIVTFALLSSFLFFLLSYFPAIKVITFTIPLIINTIMLYFLYFVTSNTKIYWRDLLLGSVVASLLLELSKIGFALYVSQFSNYNAIYGAIATLPILLIWLYIFWLIILYGAVIIKIRLPKPS